MTTTEALLAVAAVLWVIAVTVVILLQRRSAAATMAWLLALSFMPIIGLVVYRLIGPRRFERKRRRRSHVRRSVGEAVATMAELGAVSAEQTQLARVPMALGEAAPQRAHSVELYLDGAAAYGAILEAIAQARDHIHLEYYIWSPDRIGTRIRDLLVTRAKAGVAVRMVVDALGANKLGRAFLKPLRDAGAEIAWFNPMRWRILRMRRPDFRSHRKIVVCDGRVGFTGGMNITDEHSAEFGGDYWRDTHIRVDGPAVWALQRLFLDDWYFAAEREPDILPSFFPPAPVRVPGDDHHIVQIVGSGPDSADFAVHKTIFTAIGQAQTRLLMTTPYFVPDEAILTAIIGAGLRKIDVRLLVPKKSDSRLVDLAARSYFPELLEAGVRIFEYGPRFIHAKTMVVDDDVAIVGTANLDNRSFRLNFELAAVIYDDALNSELAAAFEADLASAVELRPGQNKPRFWRRLGQAAARLLSPLL